MQKRRKGDYVYLQKMTSRLLLALLSALHDHFEDNSWLQFLCAKNLTIKTVLDTKTHLKQHINMTLCLSWLISKVYATSENYYQDYQMNIDKMSHHLIFFKFLFMWKTFYVPFLQSNKGMVLIKIDYHIFINPNYDFLETFFSFSKWNR